MCILYTLNTFIQKLTETVLIKAFIRSQTHRLYSGHWRSLLLFFFDQFNLHNGGTNLETPKAIYSLMLLYLFKQYNYYENNVHLVSVFGVVSNVLQLICLFSQSFSHKLSFHKYYFSTISIWARMPPKWQCSHKTAKISLW